jgi:hypothetical protein
MNMHGTIGNKNERNNLLVGFRTFAVRGALDEQAGKPNTAMNKEKFSSAPKVAAKVAHFVAAHGFGLTSIKTWFENDRKSGLNTGQATALSKSAWLMVKESGIDCTLNDTLKGRINDHFGPMLEDWLSADDEIDNPLTEEDDMDEPLTEENDIVEDLLGEASVESSGMVSFEDIMAVVNSDDNADRMAVVQGTILAFTGADNALNGNALNFHRNGKKKKDGIGITGKGMNLTKPTDFMKKVANHCGANLAGLASWRDPKGGKREWASSLLQDASSSTLLGIAWCVVAVKAGVVTFDHDLRKYVSDETIEALQQCFVDPSADMTHDSAPTNGWYLPYQRGDADWKKSGTTQDSIVDSLLI